MTIKRGVNLGCGTLTFPRDEKPPQHYSIPDEIYHNPAIQWDNVDRHHAPGVTKLINLFAYPWDIPDNTYDIAIASHIAEHIPHEIIWNGRDWAGLSLANAPQSIRDSVEFFGSVVVPPGSLVEHQGGWYAWFSELWRIMKPGGEVRVLLPYAFSDAGVAEPTHTRYVLPVTFNYFNASPDFNTPLAQKWDIRWDQILFQGHDRGVRIVQAELADLEDYGKLLRAHSMRYLNVMFGFMMTLLAVKDETEGHPRSGEGSPARAADQATNQARSVASVADRLV